MSREPSLSDVEADVEFLWRSVPLQPEKQAFIQANFDSLTEAQRYVLGTALTIGKNGSTWIPRGTAIHGNRLNGTHYAETHYYSLESTRDPFLIPEWRWLDVIAQSIVLVHDEAEDSAALIKKLEPNRSKRLIREEQISRVSNTLLGAIEIAREYGDDEELENIISACELSDSIPIAIDKLTPDKPSRAKNRGSYVNVLDRITGSPLKPADRFASLFAMLAKPADRISNQTTLYAESKTLDAITDLQYLKTQFETIRHLTDPSTSLSAIRETALELFETQKQGYTVSSAGRVKEVFKGFLTADRFLDYLITLDKIDPFNDYEIALREAVLNEITLLSEVSVKGAEQNALVLTLYEGSIDDRIKTYSTIDEEARKYVKLPSSRKLQSTRGRGAKDRFHATIKRLNNYERKQSEQFCANYEANLPLQLQDLILFKNYVHVMSNGLSLHHEDPIEVPLTSIPRIEDDVKEFLTRRHR